MAKRKYYVRADGLHETSRTINGKRVVFRGKTDREVDKKILEYHEEKERGRTFPEVADEWAERHLPKVSLNTQVVYESVLKRMRKDFRKPIREYKPLHLARYIDSMERKGYSGSTISVNISVMKSVFSHAVIAGDIDTNPAAELKKSAGLPKKERKALTEAQEAIIKAQGTKQDAPFWLFPYFLLYTGMRRGEALALTYADIDRKNGVIHVTKKLSYANPGKPVLENWTKSKNGIRDIPLLAPLEMVMPKNRVGLIFPGDGGGYMKESNLTKSWREFCRAADLYEAYFDDGGKLVEEFPITPHCLRHSFATICYEAGLDARQAAQFLGDTPQVVEVVYTHLREKQMQNGADKLRAFCEAATV